MSEESKRSVEDAVRQDMTEDELAEQIEAQIAKIAEALSARGDDPQSVHLIEPERGADSSRELLRKGAQAAEEAGQAVTERVQTLLDHVAGPGFTDQHHWGVSPATEENVSQALAEFLAIHNERQAQTAELEREIASLEAKIEPLQEQIKAIYDKTEDRLRAIEDEIREQTQALGKTVEIEGARAKYTSGYTRFSWPNDKMEGYAIARPEVLKLRKETAVKPQVTIELC